MLLLQISSELKIFVKILRQFYRTGDLTYSI